MLYVNPADASLLQRTALGVHSGQRTGAVLQEFERLFLYQMLREMRGTVPEGGLFPKSREEEYFEETMDDYLAGEMAKTKQFCIADQMERQIRENETRQRILPQSGKTEWFPVRSGAKGISLGGKNQTGIPLAEKPVGIALEEGDGAGISLRQDMGL